MYDWLDGDSSPSYGIWIVQDQQIDFQAFQLGCFWTWIQSLRNSFNNHLYACNELLFKERLFFKRFVLMARSINLFL